MSIPGGHAVGRRRLMKLLNVLVMAAVVTLGLAAALPAPGGAQPAGQPIKVGAIFPLSGSLALLGEESFRGAELARKQRNAQGGLLGRPVEFVVGDAPNPGAAQSEAERLISRERVPAIVGSYSSSIAYAASQVAERNRVIYWETGAVSDEVTGRGFRYTFRTNPPAGMMGRDEVRFVLDAVLPRLGIDRSKARLAVIHEDSQYGTSVADAVLETAKAEGIHVVTVQPYRSDTSDLTSVVLSVKEAEPHVVIAVSYITDAILFWRQARENNLYIPAFIGSGGGHSLLDFAEGVGIHNAEGVFSVDFPQYEINRAFMPGLDDFIHAYIAEYGHPPRSAHSLAHYWGTAVLFDVIEAAGSTDPERIRATAQQYQADRSPLTGFGVRFDSTGQNVAVHFVAHQWQNGRLVAVWPYEFAIGDIQLPMARWEDR